MHLIQPCCAPKHLRELRDAIAKGGTKQFEGYGDLSLTELLPALLLRYSETEMMIVAPTLPDQAAEIIDKWMRKQWARMDGKGKLDVISHLTVVARLEKDRSQYITAWVKEQPFGDRLTLVDTEQEDTAILLPDFAITGPVNMRYGYHFEATATTEAEKVRALWEKYRKAAADAAGTVAKDGGETAEHPEGGGTPDGEPTGTGADAGEPAGTVAKDGGGTPAGEPADTVAKPVRKRRAAKARTKKGE